MNKHKLQALRELRQAIAWHTAQHRIALQQGIDRKRADDQARGFMLQALLEFLDHLDIEATPLVQMWREHHEKVRKADTLLARGHNRRGRMLDAPEAQRCKDQVSLLMLFLMKGGQKKEEAAKWIARKIPPLPVRISKNDQIDARRILFWYDERNLRTRYFVRGCAVLEQFTKKEGIERRVMCERLLKSLAFPSSPDWLAAQVMEGNSRAPSGRPARAVGSRP